MAEIDIVIAKQQSDIPALESDTLVFMGSTPVEITANKTLSLDDAEQFLQVNSSSAITITIPANSAVAFPIGTEIAILRQGTGTVTLSATSPVTLNGASGTEEIANQYGTVALRKIGTNAWIIAGDI